MAAESGPVQIAEPGTGFQHSPFGILPLGTSIAPDSDQHAPAAIRSLAVTDSQPGPRPLKAPTQSAQAERSPATAAFSPGLAPPAASSPRAVIKAAGARVKQIKVELRRMAALKKELDELERLLRAAKQKPEQRIRALRTG